MAAAAIISGSLIFLYRTNNSIVKMTIAPEVMSVICLSLVHYCNDEERNAGKRNKCSCSMIEFPAITDTCPISWKAGNRPGFYLVIYWYLNGNRYNQRHDK